MLLRVLTVLWIILNLPTALAAEGEPAPRHVVLIVWDGMRPDFATEKYAPNLDRLAREGMRFRSHHSVYPTATDVNGAALATGCYPGRNGIYANLEFRPAINPRQPIDVSDPDSVKRGDELSGEKYLSVPTFPELLRKAGKTVALVGTKSVALLFDRHNDWTVVKVQNRALTIFAGAPLKTAQRDELINLLGPFPDDRHATAAQRNDFATRALTEYFWRENVLDFSLLWLSEPDLSEHNFAPGSPQALAAIKSVDANLASVLSALEKKHARESTDVLVVSDHGFSTIRRPIDIVSLLNAAGFHASKETSDSAKAGDILVVGNGGTVLFYVRDHHPETVHHLVDWLEQSDFADVIFSREKFDGTFPLSSVHLDCTDSPDVVMSFHSDENSTNQFGTAGMIDADWNRPAGEGTHATLSRSDVHNTFIAAGPDFRPKQETDSPTANVDVAPTILTILGVAARDKMDGRVVTEALVSGKAASVAQTKTIETHRPLQNGSYSAHLNLRSVGESTYIDGGSGIFEKK